MAAVEAARGRASAGQPPGQDEVVAEAPEPISREPTRIPNELLDRGRAGGEGWVTKHLILHSVVYEVTGFQGGTPRSGHFLQRHEAE